MQNMYANYPDLRMRRLRVSAAMRELLQETHLTAAQLVAPLFVCESAGAPEPIKGMPGVFRYCLNDIVNYAKKLADTGIVAVLLFAKIDTHLKHDDGREALNTNGLLLRTIAAIKRAVPHLCIMTDVALDPFTTHGHDGLVRDGIVLNDETNAILAQMAMLHAQAGADVVAPSDMMDGRVGAIRKELDTYGYQHVAILSYAAKFSSALYGPFRNALESAPKFGDKKSYQLPYSNSREAIRDALLDVNEGADMLLVKPGLPYLDIVAKLRLNSDLPIGVYHVSGEYAMIKAAAQNGWIDEKAVALESLIACRRAGADFIVTYFAEEAAKWINKKA